MEIAIWCFLSDHVQSMDDVLAPHVLLVWWRDRLLGSTCHKTAIPYPLLGNSPLNGQGKTAETTRAIDTLVCHSQSLLTLVISLGFSQSYMGYPMLDCFQYIAIYFCYIMQHVLVQLNKE